MVFSELAWTFLIVTCIGQCECGDFTPIFTNTLLEHPIHGIAAVPGDNLTIECISNVTQFGHKVLMLSGSSFSVEDTKFGEESLLEINRTIAIDGTTDEDIQCTLIYAKKYHKTLKHHVNVTWIREIEISIGEVIFPDRLHANVTCNIPPMRPEPEVTLRYHGQYWGMSSVMEFVYTRQIQFTQLDNGHTLSCCVNLLKAGQACKQEVINVLFPPQDVDVRITRTSLSSDTAPVLVECQVGESNPACIINWNLNTAYGEQLITEDLNWTVEKKIVTGPNNGLIISESVTIGNPPADASVSCQVTNSHFPDMKLTRTVFTNSAVGPPKIEITLEEMVIPDRSNITVNCSIPIIKPEPRVTLRYMNRGSNMRFVSTSYFSSNVYTRRMVVTEVDNGQTVSCCIEIPSSDEVCADKVLDIYFPPFDMSLKHIPSTLQYSTSGSMVMECVTGESNPASVIDWHMEGLNFTVTEIQQVLGPNKGYIISQKVALPTPCIRTTYVWCSVTNDMFPHVNLTRALQIADRPEDLECACTTAVVISSVISSCGVLLITLFVAALCWKLKRKSEVDQRHEKGFMMEERASSRSLPSTSHAEGIEDSTARQYELIPTEREVEENYTALEKSEYMTLDQCDD